MKPTARAFSPSESGAIGQVFFNAAEQHTQQRFLDVLVAVNTGSKGFG